MSFTKNHLISVLIKLFKNVTKESKGKVSENEVIKVGESCIFQIRVTWLFPLLFKNCN